MVGLASFFLFVVDTVCPRKGGPGQMVYFSVNFVLKKVAIFK